VKASAKDVGAGPLTHLVTTIAAAPSRTTRPAILAIGPIPRPVRRAHTATYISANAPTAKTTASGLCVRAQSKNDRTLALTSEPCSVLGGVGSIVMNSLVLQCLFVGRIFPRRRVSVKHCSHIRLTDVGPSGLAVIALKWRGEPRRRSRPGARGCASIWRNRRPARVRSWEEAQ